MDSSGPQNAIRDTPNPTWVCQTNGTRLSLGGLRASGRSGDGSAAGGGLVIRSRRRHVAAMDLGEAVPEERDQRSLHVTAVRIVQWAGNARTGRGQIRSTCVSRTRPAMRSRDTVTSRPRWTRPCNCGAVGTSPAATTTRRSCGKCWTSATRTVASGAPKRSRCSARSPQRVWRVVRVWR